MGALQAVEQFADRLADAALATPTLLAVVPAEGTPEERKLEILRRSITLMQVGSGGWDGMGARLRGQCAVCRAQCSASFATVGPARGCAGAAEGWPLLPPTSACLPASTLLVWP